jgi:cell division protein FtsW (lipid II flippase)
MENKKFNWRHFDFLLLGAVAILTIFGIAMIRSTVAGNIDLTEANIVGRQIVFVVAGFLVILLFASIDYHFWSAISRPMYLGMMVILIVLYVVGTALFGSARWFETSISTSNLLNQPETVMILVLADFFSRNQWRIGEMRTVVRSLL